MWGIAQLRSWDNKTTSNYSLTVILEHYRHALVAPTKFLMFMEHLSSKFCYARITTINFHCWSTFHQLSTLELSFYLWCTSLTLAFAVDAHHRQQQIVWLFGALPTFNSIWCMSCILITSTSTIFHRKLSN